MKPQAEPGIIFNCHAILTAEAPLVFACITCRNTFLDALGIEAMPNTPLLFDGEAAGRIVATAAEADGTFVITIGLNVESPAARKIVAMGARGIPLRLAIGLEPVLVQHLAAGESVTLNGVLIEGPTDIVKRCILSGAKVLAADDEVGASQTHTRGAAEMSNE